ncbi:MAG: glycosyltransferase family 4 protein [Clostridiales bacterium]|nr:glycosyltransferase family 4 protein [Clostridiales bacterium]
MKKVLLIADEFPPVGGAGVQRTIKFVKYLREYGYEPIVFTRGDTHILLRDDTLIKEIPKDVVVIRTKPYDLLYQNKLLKKILYYKVLIPDGRWLWQVFSRKKLLKAISKHQPDLIYSTSFPYSDHLLARYIKKKIPHLPWVADFRDEWTNNPYFHYNIIRRLIEKTQEKTILTKCDSLITNTPFMGDNFIKSYPFIKDKMHIIPNGYDPDDYVNLVKNKQKNEKMMITYTGSLYGNRKPDAFLQSFASCLVTCPNMHVTFVGQIIKKQIMPIINDLKINNHVSFVSYLPHKDSIKKLYEGDISLLIEGEGNLPFYTGKVFEYMYLSNPILAVIPKNGAASQLIKQTRSGVVCDLKDKQGINLAITSFYKKWQQGDLQIDRNTIEIAKYQRSQLTKQLVLIFDSIL